jgi:hypothetical protein
MWYYRVSVMSGPSFHRCLAASPHLRQLLRLPAPPSAVGVACRNHPTRFGGEPANKDDHNEFTVYNENDLIRQEMLRRDAVEAASATTTSSTTTIDNKEAKSPVSPLHASSTPRLPLPLAVGPIPQSEAPPGLPTTELTPNESPTSIPTVHFPATVSHTDCPKARLTRDLQVGEVVLKEVAKSVQLAASPDAAPAPSTPSSVASSSNGGHHSHHHYHNQAIYDPIPTGIHAPATPPAFPSPLSTNNQANNHDAARSPVSPSSVSSVSQVTGVTPPISPVSPQSATSSSHTSPISPVSPIDMPASAQPSSKSPSPLPTSSSQQPTVLSHEFQEARMAPSGLRSPFARRPPMEMHSAEVRVVNDHRFDHLPCAVLSIRCDYPTPLEATPEFDPHGDKWPTNDDPISARPHMVMTYGMNAEYDRLIGFEPGM